MGRRVRAARPASCGCCSPSSAACCRALGAYAPVGWSVVSEAVGRLVAGCLLVVLGAGVVGAYLGTPLAMAATSRRARPGGAPPRRGRPESRREGARARAADARRRRLGADRRPPAARGAAERRRDHGQARDDRLRCGRLRRRGRGRQARGLGRDRDRAAPAPGGDAAGRRRAIDPRPVLLRALGLLAIVAVPSLIVFTVAPETLLRVAFGEEFVTRRGRPADPRPGDDAPGRVDARRAVHARAAPDGVPLRARGRGDRRAAAPERRRRRDAVVRGDRARRAGRRGGGVPRAGRAGAPGAGGRGGGAGALGADRRRAGSGAGARTSCGRRRSARRRRP